MDPAPRTGTVWLNGTLIAADEARIGVTDRGFQLGDGVFETLRAHAGRPVELSAHLDRLRESARALAIGLADDIDARLTGAIEELLAAEGLASPGDVTNGASQSGPAEGGSGGSTDGASPPSRGGDAAIRITVSRGPLTGRGILPAGWENAAPTVLVQAWRHVPPSAALLERGIRAITSSVRHDPASPLAGVKTTSRADHVYARLEAERAGVEDAIFLTVDGFLAEASTANVFVVTGDSLATPARSAGILAGTTRSWVLGHAGAEGLRPVERDLRPDDLELADEAFLSSSVAGIVPLVGLDRRPVGKGRPGPRTLALRAARERWIVEAAELDAAGPLTGR